MPNPAQQSLFEARADRDLGLARTGLKNLPWINQAMALLPAMKEAHSEVTGEDIRVWLSAKGLPDPHSPHAWGALTRTAVLAGLLSDTGRSRPMQIRQSHARRTPIWKFR